VDYRRPGQDVYNNLFVQNDTPSGYPERYGRVQVTALFEYGGGYGQMNAYSYQLTVTGASLSLVASVFVK